MEFWGLSGKAPSSMFQPTGREAVKRARSLTLKYQSSLHFLRGGMKLEETASSADVIETSVFPGWNQPQPLHPQSSIVLKESYRTPRLEGAFD
jgi:hypothetical protein